MRLTKLFKDNGSNVNGCPAVYTTDQAPDTYVGTDDRPGFVIQGIALDPEAAGQLEDLADTESGVWVPRNLAEQLAKLLAEQPTDAS
jgi:hypothetical protein